MPSSPHLSGLHFLLTLLFHQQYHHHSSTCRPLVHPLLLPKTFPDQDPIKYLGNRSWFFPVSTPRAQLSVRVVSHLDHSRHLLLRLCVWFLPLQADLIRCYQIGFLKCHFDLVSLPFKTQMPGDFPGGSVAKTLCSKCRVRSLVGELDPTCCN